MSARSLPRTIRLLQPRELREPSDRIQESFKRFHEVNPAIYSKLVELARQVKATGRAYYAIDPLFARLRWFFNFETQTEKGDLFKLNNNYRSRYARLIMSQESDLKGFFSVRTICRSPRRQMPKAA